MKKVYIAGKVTGLPIAECTMKFGTAQKQLENLGYEVINPLAVVGDWKSPWDLAMRKCISAMLLCDAVVLLDCWQDSKGAIVERQLADDLNMVIVNNNSFGLKVLNAKLCKNNLQPTP